MASSSDLGAHTYTLTDSATSSLIVSQQLAANTSLAVLDGTLVAVAVRSPSFRDHPGIIRNPTAVG